MYFLGEFLQKVLCLHLFVHQTKCNFKYFSSEEDYKNLFVARNRSQAQGVYLYNGLLNSKENCVRKCFTREMKGMSLNIFTEGEKFRCICLKDISSTHDSPGAVYISRKNSISCSNYCIHFEEEYLCGRCQCVSKCYSPIPYLCDCTEEQQNTFANCDDVTRFGFNKSGIYKFEDTSGLEYNAFCELDKSGIGWMIIMQRFSDNDTTFEQSIDNYNVGFGSFHSSFWIGNTNLQAYVTANPSMRLQVEYIDSTNTQVVYQFEPAFSYLLNTSGDLGVFINIKNADYITDKCEYSNMKFVVCAGKGAWWFDDSCERTFNYEILTKPLLVSKTGNKIQQASLKIGKDQPGTKLRTCEDHFALGKADNTIYCLNVNKRKKGIYCRKTYPGRIYIMKRNLQNNGFFKSKDIRDFKNGFGEQSASNFWLGLKFLYDFSHYYTTLHAEYKRPGKVPCHSMFFNFKLLDNVQYNMSYSGANMCQSDSTHDTFANQEANNTEFGECPGGALWWGTCSNAPTYRAFRWHENGEVEYLSLYLTET